MRRLRHQPNRMLDFLWLNALRSIVSSSNGDADHVEAYLAAGGDPSRILTNSEVLILVISFKIFACGGSHCAALEVVGIVRAHSSFAKMFILVPN